MNKILITISLLLILVIPAYGHELSVDVPQHPEYPNATFVICSNIVFNYDTADCEVMTTNPHVLDFNDSISLHLFKIIALNEDVKVDDTGWYGYIINNKVYSEDKSYPPVPLPAPYPLYGETISSSEIRLEWLIDFFTVLTIANGTVTVTDGSLTIY
jgi:hypothetical protein